MNTDKNEILNDQNGDLKDNNNDVAMDNDGIGENSEQTPLAQTVSSDEHGKGVLGSEGGSGWENNRPGAKNEEKLIPTVTPENDNGEAGSKGK